MKIRPPKCQKLSQLVTRYVRRLVGKRPDLTKENFEFSSGIFQRFQGFFSEILNSLSAASRLKRTRKS